MVALNPMDRGVKLTNHEFIVEIMDSKRQQRVREEITSRDGKIVDYINENRLPYMVVSDHPIAEKLQGMNSAQQQQIAKKLPLLLRDAVQNRVKVCFAETFLEKITLKRHQRARSSMHSSVKRPREEPQIVSPKPAIVSKKAAFIAKIEDEGKEYAPIQKKLEELPVIHIGKDYGVSLFHKADEFTKAKRSEEIEQEREGNFNFVEVDSQGAVANKRDRVSGHCEICGRRVSNLREHFNSKEHLKHTNGAGFYDELDQLMGSYTPHIKCPGRPVLLKRQQTPSPIPCFVDYIYRETDFGRLDDDDYEEDS